MAATPYETPALPLSPIDPGTTVLVCGPAHAGTQALGLRLLAGPSSDGHILISTNQRATRVVSQCRQAAVPLARERSTVLDCAGSPDPVDEDVPVTVRSVSGPADLTGIFMRYADSSAGLERATVENVRTRLDSVSTLLSFGHLGPVSRFVHALVGRIDATDGLGVLHVDPTIHDPVVVSTLAQFCTGRIDVRDEDAGPELRARGLPNQPRDWTPFDA